MDNALKFLLIAAGVAIVALLIGLVFNYVKQGQDVNATASEQLTETLSQFSDPKFAVYDNTVVAGSEVLNAIDRFKTDESVCVVVINGAAQTIYTSATADNIIAAASGYPSYENAWLYKYDRTTAWTPAASEVKTTYDRLRIKSSDPTYINDVATYDAIVCTDASKVVRSVVFILK